MHSAKYRLGKRSSCVAHALSDPTIRRRTRARRLVASADIEIPFSVQGSCRKGNDVFPGLPGASGKPIHGFNGWRCRRCRCSGTGAAWCRRRRPACPGKGDGLRQATHLDFLPWVGEQYRALFEQVQRSLGIGDRLRELREGLSQNAGPRRLQYAFQDDGNFGACGQVPRRGRQIAGVATIGDDAVVEQPQPIALTRRAQPVIVVLKLDQPLVEGPTASITLRRMVAEGAQR